MEIKNLTYISYELLVDAVKNVCPPSQCTGEINKVCEGQRLRIRCFLPAPDAFGNSLLRLFHHLRPSPMHHVENNTCGGAGCFRYAECNCNERPSDVDIRTRQV